jgi:DNA-binding CsgD family transcriptional regulator
MQTIQNNMENILLKTYSNQSLICNLDFVNELANLLDVVEGVAFYNFNIKKAKFTYMSLWIEQISGYPLTKFHNEGIDFLLKITHPQDFALLNHKSAFGLCPELDTKHKLNTFEFRIKHPSRNWIWLENDSVHLPLDQESCQILGAFKEITRRKESEMFLWDEIKKMSEVLGNKYKVASLDKKATNKSETDKLNLFYNNPSKLISKRELEVLQLIAAGYSTKQLADKLNISNHTVISHRKNLRAKFNVKNTAELINEASKLSWIN